MFILSQPDILNPIIKTNTGKVKGSIRFSYIGNCYGAFEGLPYAKPPVGKNRFLRPEPIISWPSDEILDVSNPSEIRCMQPDGPPYIGRNGTEDCLHLWVYSPATCQTNLNGNSINVGFSYYGKILIQGIKV